MAEVKVPEYADKLEERLKLEGPLNIDDVRLWMTEEGLEQKQINLVLGRKQSTVKFHRDGDNLIAGPSPNPVGRPLKPRGADAIPTVDEAMDRPTGQSKFQGLLESIGVDESQAKMAANFCFNAFDMENPAEVWQALRECPQVGQPVIKKQVWRLWTKTLRVDVPETLVHEINTWGKAVAPAATQGGRKFFVIDGEVVPTTADDPDGMSMSDAVRLVSIQRGKSPKDEIIGSGLVSTLLTQQGETDRKRLELDAGRRSPPEGESVTSAVITQFGELVKASLTKPPDTSFESRIDAQRHEFEARMEAQNQRFMDLMGAQGERHEHMLEMVQTNNNHSLELVRLAMEGNNSRPSFFEQIEQFIASGIIEKLKPAPTPVSMITGPGGTMTLEVYKAMREMDMKGEALSLAKTTVPELIKVAGDMASATRELAASRGDKFEDSTEEITETLRQTDCVHCGQNFNYPAGGAFLVCPYCRAPQSADGRLMVPQGPPAQLDQQLEVDGTISHKAIDPGTRESADMVPQAAPAEVDQQFDQDETSPLLLGSYFITPVSGEPPEEPKGPPPELVPAVAAAE